MIKTKILFTCVWLFFFFFLFIQENFHCFFFPVFLFFFSWRQSRAGRRRQRRGLSPRWDEAARTPVPGGPGWDVERVGMRDGCPPKQRGRAARHGEGKQGLPGEGATSTPKHGGGAAPGGSRVAGGGRGDTLGDNARHAEPRRAVKSPKPQRSPWLSLGDRPPPAIPLRGEIVPFLPPSQPRRVPTLGKLTLGSSPAPLGCRERKIILPM